MNLGLRNKKIDGKQLVFHQHGQEGPTCSPKAYNNISIISAFDFSNKLNKFLSHISEQTEIYYITF